MPERFIEIIARAIAATEGIDPGSDGNWEPWIREARAALIVMREPTKEMAETGGEAYDGMSGYESWQAMIDVALKDE